MNKKCNEMKKNKKNNHSMLFFVQKWIEGTELMKVIKLLLIQNNLINLQNQL